MVISFQTFHLTLFNGSQLVKIKIKTNKNEQTNKQKTKQKQNKQTKTNKQKTTTTTTSTLLTCYWHKISRVEAVGLKKVQLNIKNYNICVKFGAISWKNWYSDILKLKFESKNTFAHMWRIWLWINTAHYISFLLNWFSVEYRFPFQILRFLP